jgi:hypothetical protein
VKTSSEVLSDVSSLLLNEKSSPVRSAGDRKMDHRTIVKYLSLIKMTIRQIDTDLVNILGLQTIRYQIVTYFLCVETLGSLHS